MPIHANVIDAIGHTPLIRLKAASEATGCEILGKAEFMNPGGSVKDRAALAIIQDAVARGALRPGGDDRRGHRRQHRHRPRHGRLGARVSHRHRHSRDAVAGKEGHAAAGRRRTGRGAGGPLRQPQQLREIFRPARRSAGEERRRTARSGPTSSTMSPTGAAITRPPARKSGRETDGTIDGFVSAVGSGGTLAGVGMALKERNPDVKIALADPHGRGALFLLHARAC